MTRSSTILTGMNFCFSWSVSLPKSNSPKHRQRYLQSTSFGMKRRPSNLCTRYTWMLKRWSYISKRFRKPRTSIYRVAWQPYRLCFWASCYWTILVSPRNSQSEFQSSKERQTLCFRRKFQKPRRQARRNGKIWMFRSSISEIIILTGKKYSVRIHSLTVKVTSVIRGLGTVSISRNQPSTEIEAPRK